MARLSQKVDNVMIRHVMDEIQRQAFNFMPIDGFITFKDGSEYEYTILHCRIDYNSTFTAADFLGYLNNNIKNIDKIVLKCQYCQITYQKSEYANMIQQYCYYHIFLPVTLIHLKYNIGLLAKHMIIKELMDNFYTEQPYYLFNFENLPV